MENIACDGNIYQEVKVDLYWYTEDASAIKKNLSKSDTESP